MPPPLRVYGLAAVSTPQQAEDDRASLAAQRAVFMEAAQRHGWPMIRIFEVAFSRNYIRFEDARDDMLRAGIDAFAELERLWTRREIDLLLVSDGDRFGRSQPIYSRVVYELIAAGARIYYAAKGLMVDENNYMPIVAIGGFQASDEVARLRRRYEMGMRKRFEVDLGGSHPPASHVLATDSAGRKALVVDESKRRMWDDLRDLLLEGVPFVDLPARMAARGHFSQAGQMFSKAVLYRYVHQPPTWGHLAYRYTDKCGAWAYDENEPVPPGVLVRRDVIPAVWQGRDAQALIHELRRRRVVMTTGGKRAYGTHPFSSLLMCGSCGYAMGFNGGNGQPRYVCATRWTRRADGQTCSAVIARIFEVDAQAQIAAFLRRWLNLSDPDALLGMERTTIDYAAQLVRLDREIAALEVEVRAMIVQQARAADTVRHLYTAQIEAASIRLAALESERARVRGLAENVVVRDLRHVAYGDLVAQSVTAFFQQDGRAINQTLRALMGVFRFVVSEGEITGVARYDGGRRR